MKMVIPKLRVVHHPYINTNFYKVIRCIDFMQCLVLHPLHAAMLSHFVLLNLHELGGLNN